MMSIKTEIIWRVVKLAQQRCEHPPEHVSADITEGCAVWSSGESYDVKWCRICGAVIDPERKVLGP